MSEDKKLVAAFIEQMREQHETEISSVQLPTGTREYVEGRVAAGDADTLLFMLKLGYLMGLQTGFAAREAGEKDPPRGSPWGPLEA
jgi:hypothetical protein